MSLIEVTILNYLKNNLDVDCYVEKPSPFPNGEFVVLERTGQTRTNLLKVTTIAFQSYADTKYKSALLNEQVKEAMDKAYYINTHQLSSVKFVRDYDFTDTTTKKYRYQCIYEIYHLD